MKLPGSHFRFIVLLACAPLAFAAPPAMGPAKAWPGLKHRAEPPPDVVALRDDWENHDVVSLQSPQSPGILIRMRSQSVEFFTGLGAAGAGAPSLLWVKTATGVRSLQSGQSLQGSEMTASWILASFQGVRGWERFDVPWFLSLEKRPATLSLSASGLRIQFPRNDSGYIFSMPLFGYLKLPQPGNQFTEKFQLPSSGHQPWLWSSELPSSVTRRCDWWAGVAKAYPAGFQESYRVDPGNDRVTFRQLIQWLTIQDDWQTPPIRFATIPPSLALAWRFPGFPVTFSSPIHDPGYFTAFGPIAGALGVDQLDIHLDTLRYLHEVETLQVPDSLTAAQERSLTLVVNALERKFPNSWQFHFDHGGRDNFAWNIVGDVWYPRAIPLAPASVAQKASAALRIYMKNEVLRPHAPHKGMFLLHGPGIGSWGETGDAGKFMTNALQPIWAYAQFAADWSLIRERWDLIKRFFITPMESDWVSFGRYAIAEIGDEAAPCSAYARMAWAVGDHDEYLLGASTFARELVHHYVKQRAGRYFYDHQPYNQFEAMPPRIYPTDLWGSTRGWQVDGPTWGHLSSGEHQSANRWVRFHDPDVGRFHRDFLAADGAEELVWYEQAGREQRKDVYRLQAYRDWLFQDQPHIMPSLLRLRSLLTTLPLREADTSPVALTSSGWAAADIARGYSVLRKLVPIRHVRVVPRNVGPSPFVTRPPELQDRIKVLTTVQDVLVDNLTLEPRWHGWAVDASKRDGFLSFGQIRGDFGGQRAVSEGRRWLSPGCQVSWANAAHHR